MTYLASLSANHDRWSGPSLTRFEKFHEQLRKLNSQTSRWHCNIIMWSCLPSVDISPQNESFVCVCVCVCVSVCVCVCYSGPVSADLWYSSIFRLKHVRRWSAWHSVVSSSLHILKWSCQYWHSDSLCASCSRYEEQLMITTNTKLKLKQEKSKKRKRRQKGSTRVTKSSRGKSVCVCVCVCVCVTEWCVCVSV